MLELRSNRVRDARNESGRIEDDGAVIFVVDDAA